MPSSDWGRHTEEPCSHRPALSLVFIFGGRTGIQEACLQASGFSSVVQRDALGKHGVPSASKNKSQKEHICSLFLISGTEALKLWDAQDDERLPNVNEILRT